LVDQKNIDVIARVIDEIDSGIKSELGFDMVILGTGDKWLEKELVELANRNKDGSNCIYPGLFRRFSPFDLWCSRHAIGSI